MFDRSYLPPADLEFVVMTDTHYMLDPGSRQVEFESRRRQAARSEQALRQIASLDPSFVVHLGDLIQEFPESEGFAESLGQALLQFEGCGVRSRQVAGNHDVGDKPDPTMPTDWVTADSLRQYHDRFGQSWNSWDEGGCHFVILNSQIMNGPLPEVEVQQQWLEADLAAHDGMPTFIFLHLSPFLVSEREQGLGHYDNIDEPARSWLLALMRNHDVRMVFSGHSHFAFFNRVGDARMFVVPSTSFTRPGFCEVFSSAPPPERGRDDAAKLGFFLVRVRDDRASVHLIRTGGETSSATEPDDEQRIIAQTSRELDRSPLGITLRHTLAPSTEVPIAWQSTIRQPVRNDYPLLACVELGVKHLRVPASDLANDGQRERLAALRDEGVAVTATWIWSERSSMLQDVTAHGCVLDGVEIQMPNHLQPDAACVEAISRCIDEAGLPVSIAPLLPKETVAGKQHARTRVGYHVDELATLDRSLGEHSARIDRALCRVDADEDPWDAIVQLHRAPAVDHIGAIDWAVEFADTDEQAQIGRAALAMLGAATLTDARLYLEPLVDLDRTMDAPMGMLNRLCNPRAVFTVVRTLNSVLFSHAERWTAWDDLGGAGIPGRGLRAGGRAVLLLLPGALQGAVPVDAFREIVPSGPVKLIRLASGTSMPVQLANRTAIDVDEAMLLQFG